MKKRNKLLFLATLSTACLLSLASCQGAQGPKGDQGTPGINGINGTDGKNGTDGQDGKSVLSGKGVPASSLGTDGDSYIDTETFDFYVKASGTWKKEGNIKGAAGDKGDAGSEGVKGEDGTSIRTGKGEPSESLGNDGDSYIDLSNFDFYVKENGKWTKEGSIKGEQGEKGDKGENGSNGSSGRPGDDGAPGATAWSNTILPTTGGYVTVDKGSAIADNKTTVTFTAHPNTDKVVSYFAVLNNGKIIATKNGSKRDEKVQITTTMLAGGFVVSATFLSEEEATTKDVVLANNKIYDGVNEAIDAGATSIKLLKDAKLSKDIEIDTDASLVIDLNGHTLDCLDKKFYVKGSLDFVNSDGTKKPVTGTNTDGIIEIGGTIAGDASKVSKVANKSSSFKLDDSKFNMISTMDANGGDENNNYSLSIGERVIFALNLEEKKTGTAIKSVATDAKIKINADASFGDKVKTAIEITNGSATLSGEIKAIQGTAVSVSGTTTIKSEDFKVNVSESAKGIEVTGGTVSLQGSLTATNGTAVTVSGGAVTIDSNTKVSSESKESAALAVTGGSVTLNGTVSSKGTAVTVSGGTLNIEKATEGDVTPTISGGSNGVSVSGGEVTVKSGVVVTTSSSEGAAISVEKSSSASTVKVEAGAKIENESGNGDAIKNESTSKVEVDGDATIEGNGYQLTTSDGINCKVALVDDSQKSFTAGKPVSLKITPEDKISTDYVFKGVKLVKEGKDGEADEVTIVNNETYDSTSHTYKLSMPSYDVKVSALFLKSDTVCYSEVNGKLTEYSSLDAAITSASESATIEIVENTKLECTDEDNEEKRYSINNNKLTIKGNGNTLTLDGGFLEVNSPEIEFDDLIVYNKYTFKSAKSIYFMGDCKKATLNNVIIDNDSTAEKNVRGIQIDEAGTSAGDEMNLTMNNCSVDVGIAGYPLYIFRKSNIIMNNCKTNGYCAMYFENWDTGGALNPHSSVVNATNCTFIAQNNHSGKRNGFGAFSFLNTTDCELTLNNCTVDATTIYPNNACSSLLNVMRTGGYSMNARIKLTVTGNKTKIKSGDLVFDSATTGEDANTLVLQEGTYNQDPSDYVPEGYKVIDNKDGTWTVTKE